MGRLLASERLGEIARIGAIAIGCAALAHCSGPLARKDSQYGPRVVEEGEPVPKGGGSYRVGNPYSINGRTYVPTENLSYRAEGIASWYGPDFHGRLTANGEVYDMHSISAAHTTMPLPSYARVTNLANGRSMVVRVNDRGPYVRNRIMDLSIGAAKALDFYGHGLARVRVEYVGRAPLEGSDDRMLMATLREGQPAPAPSRVMFASGKPFLDDPRATPLPPERPFSLGSPSRIAVVESAGDLAASPPSRLRLRTPTAAAPAPQPAVEAWAEAPSPSSPEAGWARSGPAGLGLMSGRGLY